MEFFRIMKDILKGNLQLSELPDFVRWLISKD